MIEANIGGTRAPMPAIFMAVNRKSYRQLHEELRSIQSSPAESEGAWFMNTFLILPWPIRRLFYGSLCGFPSGFASTLAR
jgi:hypothetical protein